MATPNPFEIHARMTKALRLADVIEVATDGQATADLVHKMSETDWEFAHQLAGMRKSSIETRALVAELIAARILARALAGPKAPGRCKHAARRRSA